MAAFN